MSELHGFDFCMLTGKCCELHSVSGKEVMENTCRDDFNVCARRCHLCSISEVGM